MTKAILKVPVTLRAITMNKNELTISTGSLKKILEEINQQYPQLKEKLLDSTNTQISPYMNVYINGRDIRFLQQLDTIINEGDVLTILPTVAGG